MSDQSSRILEYLYVNCGVDLRGYRKETLERRLTVRMAATGCVSCGQYIDYLQEHPGECEDFIDALTIKVSGFFRDPPVYEILKNKTFPDLLSARTKQGKSFVSVWSAGCARGQEAYTAAMLLHDLAAKEAPFLTLHIVGTDVDARSLQAAREGRYPAGELAGTEEGFLKRYFVKEGDYYRVVPEIRRMVTFGRHNLTGMNSGGPSEGLFASYDIIFCRNVLIYYNRDRQSRVLKRLAGMLNTGGCLVLGKAESLPRELSTAMPEAYRGTKIYFKRESLCL
ncbi:CheR family methyltransferase [Desulfotomaculum copahuensis]|uniref:protein-glutamate O-methyltransferase n=1 Tax=Desulfotomaculum copahuensis TaxID=1838280 RepID=A0A1B7LGE4_9FIRM|nr:protein-glutamate O-methyltransferase CheR [Desulfotomaculum copahuensis]OAT85177.1 hypothetical protein A6M21_06400 [Desulfotomaculum copahuensis]